jgi:hypothetical protein
MDFKKGSEYTRNEILTLYFDKPVPSVGTGKRVYREKTIEFDISI